MDLKILKNKRILILGFAREGIDSFRFLRKLLPKKVLGIGDRLKISNLKSQISNLLKKDKKVRLHFGEDYLKAIKNYDIIIKTPGIPPKTIKPFLKKGQRVTSQTEIFFENCKGLIVGVTGTKGKSTTASLIYEILKEGRLKAHLIGNIGKPALSHLGPLFQKKLSNRPKLKGVTRPTPVSRDSRQIYVYELSSHQLMSLEESPHIAVFLNIYPEHGDYYRNFNEYLKAKQNICRWQKKEDYFIYNRADKNVRETAKITKAKKIPIPTNYKFITNIRIKDKIPLIGKFNFKNIMVAVAVGKIFGISNKKIQEVIKKFKPLPHRLEFVGEFSGIKFYNDSLSTIPETTIVAIEALKKNLQTIILGGFDRGQDFKELVKRILDSNIETVILFPTTGERIWKQILRSQREPSSLGRGWPEHFFVEDIKEAVKLCYQNTERGKICLLSPASASFNLFKDYRQRGNLFKKLVKNFAKPK